MRIALPALALAAAVRVIDRVHRQAAHGGPPALPAVPAGLADPDDLVLGVAQLPHRRLALEQDLADLGRGHADLGVLSFLGHQLAEGAGRPDHLRAVALLQLDVVDHRAERNGVQRERISRADVHVLAGGENVADVHADRPEDVALLAVGVVEQRDARRAVGVVFDRRHLGRHAVLVAPPVDDPQTLLVAAPAVPRGHAAIDVPAAGALERHRQRLLRVVLGDLGEVGRRGQAASRAGRFVGLERHRLLPLEELDRVAFLERHDRLLPVGPLAFGPADAPELAPHDRGLHVQDLHLEELLDGLLDLGLVGLEVDLEGELVLAVAHAIELLGVERALDDLEAVHASTPWSAAAASLVRSSVWWRRMSYTLAPSTGRNLYLFALRTDLKRFWLSLRPSTRALWMPSFAKAFTASLVDGFAGAQASTTTSALSWLRLLIAARSAAFRTFFGTWYSWSRILGAIALPPPTHWLARMEPCRARPVPFCL